MKFFTIFENSFTSVYSFQSGSQQQHFGVHSRRDLLPAAVAELLRSQQPARIAPQIHAIDEEIGGAEPFGQLFRSGSARHF